MFLQAWISNSLITDCFCLPSSLSFCGDDAVMRKGEGIGVDKLGVVGLGFIQVVSTYNQQPMR
jgi:hypothetical protein